MAKSYARDLRERLVRAVLAGQSRRKAARGFDVGASRVIKLMQQVARSPARRTGHRCLGPRPPGGKCRRPARLITLIAAANMPPPVTARFPAREGMIQATSRKRNCCDNAPMESCFGTLNTEPAYQACDKTKDAAGHDLFASIEGDIILDIPRNPVMVDSIRS